MAEIERIALSQLNVNEHNPRYITDKKMDLLVQRLLAFPKMIDLRPVVVDDMNVALGGNMRLRAFGIIAEKNITEIENILAQTKNFQQLTEAERISLCNRWAKWLQNPTVPVVKASTLTEEEKREFVIADNASFGSWDYDALANEWDAEDLANWGLDVWEAEDDEPLSEEAEDDEPLSEEAEDDEPLSEEAEELLNKAMQQYCGEFAAQIDYMLERGQISTGLTEGYAKIKFLRAKYLGKEYPRKCSLIFTPQQFKTSSRNYYDQLKRSAKDGKAGIAGFRTSARGKDDNLSVLFSSSYPICGSKGVLDFPVSLARKLIHEYAKGGDVLDPCHGWGGRLVGAMLEDVKSYTGIDPSPDAHDGVTRISKCFEEYSKTTAKLIKQPFEDVQLKAEAYDMALTSPPYFDVEEYAGEDTSTSRYPKYEEWRESFYKPLILNTMQALKRGAVFCLQVGAQKYPLVKDAISIAQDSGYTAEIIAQNVLGNINGTEDERSEQIILIKK